MAKLGKVDEARAAYQKYVDLNPTDAALAWRNFGIVPVPGEPHEGSDRATSEGPGAGSEERAGLVFAGRRLVNTMEFKTEGDKITPIMQPGTLEAYQKAIDLDPNGPIGAQAKQGLDQLQASGPRHYHENREGRRHQRKARKPINFAPCIFGPPPRPEDAQTVSSPLPALFIVADSAL